jgi:hypothetical protein
VTLNYFFQYKPLTYTEAIVCPIVADGTDVLLFKFGLHFHPLEPSKYKGRMPIVMNKLKKTSHNISLLVGGKRNLEENVTNSETNENPRKKTFSCDTTKEG